MENNSDKLPKIFHVNWFRKDKEGKFLWPGFGDNSRVLDWILRRLDGEDCSKETAIGLIPTENALNLSGLKEKVNIKELFSIPKEFWLEEVYAIEKYFDEQVGMDLPDVIQAELKELKKRVKDL